MNKKAPLSEIASDLGYQVPVEVAEILAACPGFSQADNEAVLMELAMRDANDLGYHEVAYEVAGRGSVIEASVCRVTNGLAANYPEPYMRRRDPDCMYIGDRQPTNKPKFDDTFGQDFEKVRQETFEWLKTQELAVFPFVAGMPGKGTDALVIAPANAGFFALGLAMLQGILSRDEIPANFNPKAVIYVAPPFRHTHFEGKQVVVHNRRKNLH